MCGNCPPSASSPTLIIAIYIFLTIALLIGKQKQIKDIQIGKEEIKLFLFINDKIKFFLLFKKYLFIGKAEFYGEKEKQGEKSSIC